MSRFITLAVFIAILALVAGHSQMRCAKYDKATKTCSAPIRRQPEAFLQEAYSWNTGAALCQSPMSTPMTAAYADGADCASWAGGCPQPMGTYAPGEVFTVMWFARNHAVDNQSPGTVDLYLSPAEDVNQGRDVSEAVMEAGKFCSGPYMNCGGENVDQTHCTLTCTMPQNLAKGYYTMWWKWNWQNGAKYATCADINVLVGGNTPVPATTSVKTTGVQTTGVQTTGVKTTGVQTTGVKTTGVQTTGVKTTGVKTTGVQTTGVKTTGVKTTGVQTTGVKTTGIQTTTGSTTPNNCTATADYTACVGTSATQRCYLGRLYDAVPCQTGLVCKYSPSTVDKLGNQNGYCMRPTDIPRENEHSASTQLINSLWVSMILVAVCYLL